MCLSVRVPWLNVMFLQSKMRIAACKRKSRYKKEKKNYRGEDQNRADSRALRTAKLLFCCCCSYCRTHQNDIIARCANHDHPHTAHTVHMATIMRVRDGFIINAPFVFFFWFLYIFFLSCWTMFVDSTILCVASSSGIYHVWYSLCFIFVVFCAVLFQRVSNGTQRIRMFCLSFRIFNETCITYTIFMFSVFVCYQFSSTKNSFSLPHMPMPYILHSYVQFYFLYFVG